MNRLSRPDEQTEIDDEISDQLKEDAGSRHDVPIMPQIPSGFGQNRGILFFAEDSGISLDGIPQGRKSSRIYCSIRYGNFATDPQIAKCLCAGNRRDKSVGFSQLFATDS